MMATISRRYNSSRVNAAAIDAERQMSTSIDTRDFSSYSPATVLMFALSSFGGALALIPILLPDTEWMESIEIYGLLRTILSIIVSIVCFSLVHYKRMGVKSGQWPDYADTVSLQNVEFPDTHDQQAKYLLTTIMVFGFCSLPSSVLQTAAELSSYILRDIVHCVFDIISLLAQMIFFYYYVRGRLPNTRGLHYAIAILIGIKICTWIAVTLEPLWETGDSKYKPIIPHNETENETETNPALEFFDEFFETFYTEFHTTAVGVLFYIWHSMEKFNHIPARLRSISTHDEATPLLGDYRPDSFLGQSTEVSQTQRNWYDISLILISLVLSTAYACICIMTTRENIFNQPAGNIYVYRGITLSYYCAFNGIAIYKLLKLRSKPGNNSPHFNSSEYLLLFTACSESVYYFLRGAASIGSFTSESHGNATTEQLSLSMLFHKDPLPSVPDVTNLMAGVFLSYSFVAITNCWTQTMLFLVIRRKQAPGYDKRFLILFAGVNFSEWLQSAILLGLARKDTVPRFTPVMNSFFGPGVARVLILILLPTMILFRFHLAIVSVELVHET